MIKKIKFTTWKLLNELETRQDIKLNIKNRQILAIKHIEESKKCFELHAETRGEILYIPM